MYNIAKQKAVMRKYLMLQAEGLLDFLCKELKKDEYEKYRLEIMHKVNLYWSTIPNLRALINNKCVLSWVRLSSEVPNKIHASADTFLRNNYVSFLEEYRQELEKASTPV